MRALFIRTIPAVFIVPLLAAPGAAQERCKWSSDSDPSTVTSYPQQLNIDVGDAPGHIVGVYEIHSVVGPNAKPNCEGLKDKETWTHGYRDWPHLGIHGHDPRKRRQNLFGIFRDD
jgi:hypothetical protein